MWSIKHVQALLGIDTTSHQFTIIWALAFAIMAWQVLLAYMEPTHTLRTDRQRRQVDALCVVVAVPVYNEDPEALRQGLASLLRQTRKPQEVYVVDDGSTTSTYEDVREWFVAEAAEAGVMGVWLRQPNGGKRKAQGLVFGRTPHADVYLTVDSDSILADNALEEGMKPFADKRVMSVAGVVVALNNTKNLLCRVTDLWFVVGQLVDRSSLSTMGSVLVNSGPLALYRGWVIREHLDGYLNETFFGRPVEFSDDSMLTIYALNHGRAVQQPSAYAFTLMPENMRHHIRQYVRWMRGAFIRSWWRVRHLPLTGYAFWAHLVGWAQMAMGAVVFTALFVVEPLRDPRVVPYYLVVPIVIGYGMALRYLALKRSDQTFASQFLTFALAPLAAIWALFALRVVRWYAIATCLSTGWGTRKKVELTMQEAVS
jgi:hyaluronan synthase